VDVGLDTPESGDLYLLCSDGLTDMLNEQEIGEIVADDSATVAGIVERLIELANDAGGRDNITAILFRFGDPSPKSGD